MKTKHSDQAIEAMASLLVNFVGKGGTSAAKMLRDLAAERAELLAGNRDYFAAQALAGILANPVRWQQIAADYENGRKTYEQCSMANAVKAYSLADAMLIARQPSPTSPTSPASDAEGKV